MLCVLENKHGKIWCHNFLGNSKKEYSKFVFNSWKKEDLKSFRDFMMMFHDHDFDTTNKVVGDMLHHGVTYRFKGEKTWD